VLSVRVGAESFKDVGDVRGLDDVSVEKFHPGSSSGMFVLVKGVTEAVTSADVRVGEPVRVGDRFGRWSEWLGVGDARVRAMFVVEDLELA
jgi:hypothetical protein